jgi:hypothetical protein
MADSRLIAFKKPFGSLWNNILMNANSVSASTDEWFAFLSSLLRVSQRSPQNILCLYKQERTGSLP